MHRNGYLWISQFDRFHRVLDTHRKIIPDREQHIVELSHLSDQLHVIKETGISCMIDTLSLDRQDYPGSFSGIIVIGSHTAVMSNSKFHPTECELMASPDMHIMSLESPGSNIISQFINANEERPVLISYFHSITYMVSVTVGDNDIISTQITRVDRCEWIVFQKRIDQDFLTFVGGDLKSGMG